MKNIQALILILLVSSCGVTVNYDYEKGTDFTQYKTYNYFSDMQTGFSELDAKRFFNALETELQIKGLALSETPDFIIDVKSTTFQNQQSNSVGMGVGTGGGGVSVGIPIGQGSVSRKIILDFVDGGNQQLFWQGVSREPSSPANTPEARSEQFHNVVKKILDKYPPKK
ncbi:DUF4136 domain-containing protein [Bizionia argentinensis JUB59]|uniref:DUF4136 domain-containing protein n=1 Tax=Bizionia argentinensis JUB59 TaxID=1046627 RepID=G2EBM1_9FLAO|nr:DUF4136 domain-containing protein [Bizionia argentinensis]EGV44101.1 DUF4136 domain-containing protein [Bizionia argentinensis JUB59]